MFSYEQSNSNSPSRDDRSRNHYDQLQRTVNGAPSPNLNEDSESTYSMVKLNPIQATPSINLPQVKPYLAPIPYTGLNKKLTKQTVKEFNLNAKE